MPLKLHFLTPTLGKSEILGYTRMFSDVFYIQTVVLHDVSTRVSWYIWNFNFRNLIFFGKFIVWATRVVHLRKLPSQPGFWLLRRSQQMEDDLRRKYEKKLAKLRGHCERFVFAVSCMICVLQSQKVQPAAARCMSQTRLSAICTVMKSSLTSRKNFSLTWSGKVNVLLCYSPCPEHLRKWTLWLPLIMCGFSLHLRSTCVLTFGTMLSCELYKCMQAACRTDFTSYCRSKQLTVCFGGMRNDCSQDGRPYRTVSCFGVQYSSVVRLQYEK